MTRLYLFNRVLNEEDIFLPEEIIMHSNSYKIKEKRLISLSNYAYLAKELTKLGLSINSLGFINDKPIIPGIYLSVSHTDSLFGFIISNKEIGLDIEALIPEKRLNLANKILSTIEYQEFINSSNKALYLTNKWTLKEAYSKYLGTGLSDDIFSKEIKGLNLEIEGKLIGIYGDIDKLEIYLNNDEIKRI